MARFWKKACSTGKSIFRLFLNRIFCRYDEFELLWIWKQKQYLARMSCLSISVASIFSLPVSSNVVFIWSNIFKNNCWGSQLSSGLSFSSLFRWITSVTIRIGSKFSGLPGLKGIGNQHCTYFASQFQIFISCLMHWSVRYEQTISI